MSDLVVRSRRRTVLARAGAAAVRRAHVSERARVVCLIRGRLPPLRASGDCAAKPANLRLARRNLTPLSAPCAWQQRPRARHSRSRDHRHNAGPCALPPLLLLKRCARRPAEASQTHYLAIAPAPPAVGHTTAERCIDNEPRTSVQNVIRTASPNAPDRHFGCWSVEHRTPVLCGRSPLGECRSVRAARCDAGGLADYIGANAGPALTATRPYR